MLQPTGFCNIDCQYCYLAQRDNKARMPVAIAQQIAQRVREYGREINIVWHAGEPLSVGESYLRRLFECFEPVRAAGLVNHSVQTNGTLIDETWCSFFKQFEVSVGLSIDGPEHMNRDRVDRQGRETFGKVLRAARLLRSEEIPFSTISVVSKVEAGMARELLAFLNALDPTSTAFNVIESDGVFKNAGLDDESARRFWHELRATWEGGKFARIREVEQLLNFARFVCSSSESAPPLDWLLSIDAGGHVRALSPELIELKSSKYQDFVVANIATDTLEMAISQAENSLYVREFLEGVGHCQASCEYFSFCRGGSLSNKLVELNDLTGTETRFCRQSRKMLWDAFSPLLLEEA